MNLLFRATTTITAIVEIPITQAGCLLIARSIVTFAKTIVASHHTG